MTLFCSFCIILNILDYCYALFPQILCRLFNNNIYLIDVANVLEAITAIFGLYGFHSLELSAIYKLYNPISSDPPRWIINVFHIENVVCNIAVLTCYTLHFVYHHEYKHNSIYFIYIFYAILYSRMTIDAIIILCAASKMLNILKKSSINSPRRLQIKYAIKRIKCSIYALGMNIIFFLSVVIIVFTIIFNPHPYLRPGHVTFGHFMHSIFYILILIAMIIWIYKEHTCCKIQIDSVCDACIKCECYRFCCTCKRGNINTSAKSVNINKNNERFNGLLQTSTQRVSSIFPSPIKYNIDITPDPKEYINRNNHLRIPVVRKSGYNRHKQLHIPLTPTSFTNSGILEESNQSDTTLLFAQSSI
eukprot:17953_1